jgi:hypothetical protein
MISIVHPLADELLGLVEAARGEGEPERDTSWRWMALVVAGIGLIAWVTR